MLRERDPAGPMRTCAATSRQVCHASLPDEPAATQAACPPEGAAESSLLPQHRQGIVHLRSRVQRPHQQQVPSISPLPSHSHSSP